MMNWIKLLFSKLFGIRHLYLFSFVYSHHNINNTTSVRNATSTVEVYIKLNNNQMFEETEEFVKQNLIEHLNKELESKIDSKI